LKNRQGHSRHGTVEREPHTTVVCSREARVSSNCAATLGTQILAHWYRNGTRATGHRLGFVDRQVFSFPLMPPFGATVTRTSGSFELDCHAVPNGPTTIARHIDVIDGKDGPAFERRPERHQWGTPTNSGGMDVGHTNPTRQRGECRRNPRWRVGLVWPAVCEVGSEAFTIEVS
jgi:hypothetical protein